jgi:hypothetical protein
LLQSEPPGRNPISLNSIRQFSNLSIASFAKGSRLTLILSLLFLKKLFFRVTKNILLLAVKRKFSSKSEFLLFIFSVTIGRFIVKVAVNERETGLAMAFWTEEMLESSCLCYTKVNYLRAIVKPSQGCEFMWTFCKTKEVLAIGANYSSRKFNP